MTSINNLKKELASAAKIKESWERAVAISAIIAETLRTIHQDPILVGGTAVEFYTQGAYSTADIDMITEGGPELVRLMSELGFKKYGKDFAHPHLKIYIEFPGHSLGDSEKDKIIKIGKRYLRIISIEDLIVDRLAAFKFWKSAIDGVNALLLLELGEADLARVEQRTKEEEVDDAFMAVQEVLEAVIRKKLPRNEANQLLKQKMRSLK